MDEERRSRLPVAISAAAFLVLPAIYALAAGPVNALMNNGCIPEGSLAWKCAAFAYSPVVWAMQHFEPINAAVTWYLDLWT